VNLAAAVTKLPNLTSTPVQMVQVRTSEVVMKRLKPPVDGPTTVQRAALATGLLRLVEVEAVGKVPAASCGSPHGQHSRLLWIDGLVA
jgi:hypothetical protein